MPFRGPGCCSSTNKYTSSRPSSIKEILLFLLVSNLGYVVPTSAKDLRPQVDSAIVNDDPQKLNLIFLSHKEAQDRTEVFEQTQDKIRVGAAPDGFANSMVLMSLLLGRKEDALAYLDYYRALVALDTAACPDPSAGGSLLEGTMFLFGRLTNDPTVTAEQKKAAVDQAMVLEEQTSSRRKIDPKLCQAGLSEYAKDLHVDLDHGSGKPGRTGPNGSASSGLTYTDNPSWRRNREATLPRLKTMLLTLSGVTTKD